MNSMGSEKLRKPRTRHWFAAVVALAVAVVIAAFVARRQEARTDVAESPAAVKPASDTIEASPEQMKQIHVDPVVDREIDQDLETTGKVGFNEDRMSPVFAPYSGRVLEVLANKGDVVKAGQTLLVIESPDLVATAHDLAEARSDVDKAKIALDIADKAAARARNLHSVDALATKDLQSAESDLARAKEDLRRANAAVTVMRNKLSLFGKNADEIRSLEDATSNEMDRRVEVRAPLAGTIVDRKVGPGQYIKPDMPDPMFLIGDLSNVWVNADVYESHLQQVRIGAPATITVAAYPDREFPARISAINPTLDPSTRTIRVRCLVPNPAGLLKPEMFASMRIGNSVKRKVKAVPSTAVITQGSDSFVLREEPDGRFKRRQVKPGREVEGYVVIEDGLASNDRVVTSGALLLNNGLSSK
jgi:membrane fusion protein, heavy metal efflux system